MNRNKKYRGPFAKLQELKDRHAAAVARKARAWERCKRGTLTTIRAEAVERRLQRAIEREVNRLKNARAERKQRTEPHTEEP